MARNGTDAGVVHRMPAGCPRIVRDVPTRHLHSHVGIPDLPGVESAIRLVVADKTI